MPDVRGEGARRQGGPPGGAMGPAKGSAQGTAAKTAAGALPAKAEEGAATGPARSAKASVDVKKAGDAEVGANAGQGQPDVEEDEDEDEEDEVAPEAQPSFPRNEVDKAVSNVRLRAVHVYGLDFLKTGHMDEIFSQFKHKWIEWINDSSANIVFGDEAGAKKALESLSFPKASARARGS
ncbi:unnamed protein product [Prorocentrum cordatum]|uniref:Uncharacterized protein n=1 Tax=Prorocentrum cordatum TaxID=2364126 RepID=A0ABN9X1Z1_9DINO|nr:unnamed protein product [Polarella glacialis]